MEFLFGLYIVFCGFLIVLTRFFDIWIYGLLLGFIFITVDTGLFTLLILSFREPSVRWTVIIAKCSSFVLKFGSLLSWSEIGFNVVTPVFWFCFLISGVLVLFPGILLKEALTVDREGKEESRIEEESDEEEEYVEDDEQDEYIEDDEEEELTPQEAAEIKRKESQSRVEKARSWGAKLSMTEDGHFYAIYPDGDARAILPEDATYWRWLLELENS